MVEVNRAWYAQSPYRCGTSFRHNNRDKATGRRFSETDAATVSTAHSEYSRISLYFINALNSGGNSCWRYRVAAAAARPARQVAVSSGIGRIHRQAPAGRGPAMPSLSCRLTGKRARFALTLVAADQLPDARVLIRLFHLVAKHRAVNGWFSRTDGIARHRRMSI